MSVFKVITKKEDWLEKLKTFKSDWYHSWSYHEMAFKRNEGKPILFVMTDNANESIAIPLLLRSIEGYEQYNDMTSVYGYPGFLISSINAETLYDPFIEKIKIWSNKNNVVSIFSRLNSLLVSADKINGAIPHGETVLIDLSSSEDEQRARYRSVHRNLLVRLEKNDFKSNWSNKSESVDDFKNIYRKNMETLGADDFYFFDDLYFDDLLNSSEFNVRIYNVWQNKTKVCSGLFIFYDDIVQYHLSGVLQQYKNFSPTLMLIDQARKDATKLGYKYLHLGGGLGAEKDGLFNFKFGFSKKSLNFYFFKMVVDISAYKKLSNLPVSASIPSTGYFPLYRKIRE